MANRYATAHVYRVLATKTLPFFIGLAFFIIYSPYTHQYVSWVDPLDLHIFIFLLYTGGIFIAEGVFSYPQVRGHGMGTFGAWLLFILGALAWIFAFVILVNLYDPQPSSDEINQVFSLILLLATIMFFVQSHEEIINNRHLYEALLGRYKKR